MSIWERDFAESLVGAHETKRLVKSGQTPRIPARSRFWVNYERDESIEHVDKTAAWPEPTCPDDTPSPFDKKPVPAPMWLRPGDIESQQRLLDRWGPAMTHPRHPWSYSKTLESIIGAYNLQGTILTATTPSGGDIAGGFAMATHHVGQRVGLALGAPGGPLRADHPIIEGIRQYRFVLFAKRFATPSSETDQVWAGVLLDAATGRTFAYDNYWEDGEAENRLIAIAGNIRHFFAGFSPYSRQALFRQLTVLDVPQVSSVWCSGVIMLDYFRHFNNFGNLGGPDRVVEDTLTDWVWRITAEFNKVPRDYRHTRFGLRKPTKEPRPSQEPAGLPTPDAIARYETLYDKYSKLIDKRKPSNPPSEEQPAQPAPAPTIGFTPVNRPPRSGRTIWAQDVREAVIAELRAAGGWNTAVSYTRHLLQQFKRTRTARRSPYLTESTPSQTQFIFGSAQGGLTRPHGPAGAPQPGEVGSCRAAEYYSDSNPSSKSSLQTRFAAGFDDFGRWAGWDPVVSLETLVNLYNAQGILHMEDFLQVEHLTALARFVTRDARCKVWIHPLNAVSWDTDREEGGAINVDLFTDEHKDDLRNSDVVVHFLQVKQSHFVCLVVDQTNGKSYFADSSFSQQSNQEFADAVEALTTWYRLLEAPDDLVTILLQRARVVDSAQQPDGYSCGVHCVDWVRCFVMEGLLDTRFSGNTTADESFYRQDPSPLVSRYKSWITAEFCRRESIHKNPLLRPVTRTAVAYLSEMAEKGTTWPSPERPPRSPEATTSELPPPATPPQNLRTAVLLPSTASSPLESLADSPPIPEGYGDCGEPIFTTPRCKSPVLPPREPSAPPQGLATTGDRPARPPKQPVLKPGAVDRAAYVNQRIDPWAWMEAHVPLGTYAYGFSRPRGWEGWARHRLGLEWDAAHAGEAGEERDRRNARYGFRR